MTKPNLSSDTLEIQQAFLEGTQLIFDTLFTNQVEFQFLDFERSSINSVYKESVNKVYKEPIYLSGKVLISNTQGESPNQSKQVTATITVPIQDLKTKDIDYSVSSFPILEQAIITYKDTTFLVDRVSYASFVADTPLFLTFECSEDKKQSIKEPKFQEVPPVPSE